ncbi:nucleoside hydrolase [Streptomyces sp. PB17]|uniref:nucleoside hydrolase n=1 Tax=Streptomyces sp. PB17 TaxID=3384158 RepID=UPI0038B613F1
MLSPAVTTDGWVKAMRWYHDLFADGLSPCGVTSFQLASFFTSGKVPFFVGGPWNLGSFAGLKEFAWSTAPQPYFEGGRPVTPTDSWSWGINASQANLARAIGRAPGFAEAVRTLYLMGGHFGPDAQPEHNIVSDIAAARAVFAAGIPTVITGIETTRRVRIGRDGIERIRAAGPYGVALAREIDAWTGFTGEGWSVPHDPITALSMLRPDLYRTEPGTVTVDDDGVTAFHRDPSGHVRLVVDAELDQVAEEIVARIERAGTTSATTA